MSRRHLERTLGLSGSEAHQLLARARNNLGSRGLAVRGFAFTLATNSFFGRLLPRTLRRAAIRPLVYALIPGPTENLLYARVTSLEDGGGMAAGS